MRALKILINCQTKREEKYFTLWANNFISQLKYPDQLILSTNNLTSLLVTNDAFKEQMSKDVTFHFSNAKTYSELEEVAKIKKNLIEMRLAQVDKKFISLTHRLSLSDNEEVSVFVKECLKSPYVLEQFELMQMAQSKPDGSSPKVVYCKKLLIDGKSEIRDLIKVVSECHYYLTLLNEINSEKLNRIESGVIEKKSILDDLAEGVLQIIYSKDKQWTNKEIKDEIDLKYELSDRHKTSKRFNKNLNNVIWQTANKYPDKIALNSNMSRQRD